MTRHTTFNPADPHDSFMHLRPIAEAMDATMAAEDRINLLTAALYALAILNAARHTAKAPDAIELADHILRAVLDAGGITPTLTTTNNNTGHHE